jgi:EAL domain-containing protein (putative c-di-GMP-specific phosphodiesterase class I)
MDNAKQRGRGKYVYFSESMQDDIREKSSLETDLFRSIERNEISLMYQPQIDLSTGQVSGVEALVRWYNAEKSAIDPEQFISYAEENGFIIQLGKWDMQEALKQCEKWKVEHQIIPRIAINVSARQLHDESFLADVEEIFSNFNINGTTIEFEIIENLFLGDDQHTLDLLSNINCMGIELAIDDFGKGYSSLRSLKKLPVQTFKIDKLFVKDIVTDSDSLAIVRAIIAMGRELNKEIIVEGVETAEQLDILRGLGCHHAQGYYIGRPGSAQELTKMMNSTSQLNNARTIMSSSIGIK